MGLGSYDHCLYEEYRTEPVSLDEKEFFLDILHIYREHTPNKFLKTALQIRLLPEVLEEGEEFAYLADYEALFTQALTLFKTDDKHHFAELLAKHRGLIDNFPPIGLFEDVCKHKAVGCASAFFEAGFDLNLNNMFQDSEFYPLDYGALHLSLPLTQVLLHNGADAGNVTAYGFPLMIAIEQLRHTEYLDQWTDDKSIFKLLYILCLPELKEPLAIIKLLASHMDQKQLERVYNHYVHTGNVCKLTVLLMAAKDQLLVPSGEGGGLETTAIGEYILKELTPESEQESSSSVVYHSTYKKPDIQVFEKAYDVIKIMWIAADVLDRYRNSERIENVLYNEVPFDIAHDLVNAELTLNPNDVYCNDIKCLKPSSPSKAKALSKKICFQKQLHSTSSLCSLVVKPVAGVSLYTSLTSSHYHSMASTRKHAVPSSLMSNSQMRASRTDFPVGMHLSKTMLLKRSSFLNVCAPLLSIVKRSIK